MKDKNRRRDSRVAQLLALLATQVALFETATAHAQANDGARTRSPVRQTPGPYEVAKAEYRRAPTVSAAVVLLEAGARSTRPVDRLECSRWGTRWVRDGALVGLQAEAANASVYQAERELGLLAFRVLGVRPVWVDGARIDPEALVRPVVVLPGSHHVAVGSLEADVYVSPGQFIEFDPGTARDFSGKDRWSQAPRYWPQSKVATEVALTVCAAAGVTSSLTYLYAQNDDLERGSHRIEGAERGFVITGVAVGAACVVGALVVPFAWAAPARRVPTTSPNARFGPLGLGGSF